MLVVVGAAVTAMNGWAPYEFLEQLPVDETFNLDVALARRTIRLAVIFEDEATEQGPIGGVAANEADNYRSEDWSRFTASATADFDGRPASADPSEMPIPDHQRERVRPSRPTAVDWEGWGREPDVVAGYYDDRPSPRAVPKQRSPLYDRRR
jgi:hypothetical protein